MAMKGALHFPKLQYYWSLTIKLFLCHIQALNEEGFYPSAEVQSVYSTALADCAKIKMNEILVKN